MTTLQSLITEHIAIWTSADTTKKSGRGRSSGNAASVYGIKKLRELILELAVRGKLVPQDPKDEPARDLLKKIKAEKAKLIQIGNINNNKLLPPISEDEKLFKLPAGWEWVRFGTTAQHNSGKTLDKGRNTGTLRPYITTSNLYWGFFELSNVRQMPMREDEIEKCTARKGDLLICEGGESGRAAVWSASNEICFQNHVHRARFYSEINPYYIYRFFEKLNATGEINQHRKGVGISNMSSKALSLIVYPLPPLAEQHRIVAKVDELMALCDQLEAQHNNAAEAHEKIVSVLLETLTQSTDAKNFTENWQRIATHFDTLFTTETSIDALKQTLLQLAVMGKLVPQDPNDEPANELLKRLRKDRQNWLAEKSNADPESRTMLRKLAGLRKVNAPFPLPKSWTTAHLIDCCRLLVDCHNKTAPYSFSGIPIIRTSNIRDREFKLEDMKYVSEATYNFWSRRCPPTEGDIMFTREAPMGEAAIIPKGVKYCLGQRSMLVRPMHDFVYNEFLLLALTEPHLLERSSASAIGSTVKHLRVGDVEELNIPIPPLVEQHRIVAKVDELMTLCDQLKTRITAANQLQQKLADVMIEKAVA